MATKLIIIPGAASDVAGHPTDRILNAAADLADDLYLGALRSGSPADPIIEICTLALLRSSHARLESFTVAMDLAEAEQVEEAGGLAFVIRDVSRAEMIQVLEQASPRAAERLRSGDPGRPVTTVLMMAGVVIVHSRPVGGR